MQAMLGTMAGDVLARRWPNSGRILTAQLSVLLSLPLSCLLLKGLPTYDVGHRTAMRSLYALVMFLFGLCISWYAACISCHCCTLNQILHMLVQCIYTMPPVSCCHALLQILSEL